MKKDLIILWGRLDSILGNIVMVGRKMCQFQIHCWKRVNIVSEIV